MFNTTCFLQTNFSSLLVVGELGIIIWLDHRKNWTKLLVFPFLSRIFRNFLEKSKIKNDIIFFKLDKDKNDINNLFKIKNNDKLYFFKL
jgi:hypothetical protein